MRLYEERLHEYYGYHGCLSCCRLRIYEPARPFEGWLVIATELDGNPGTSITNMAERLATSVFRYLEKPRSGFVWIEHYEDRAFVGRRPQMKEHFDRVTFDTDPITGAFCRPKWRRIQEPYLEAILGCPV